MQIDIRHLWLRGSNEAGPDRTSVTDLETPDPDLGNRSSQRLRVVGPRGDLLSVTPVTNMGSLSSQHLSPLLRNIRLFIPA